MTPKDASRSARYLAPSRIDRLISRALGRLVRVGVSVWGARELRVRGRRSGQIRTTIVNVLEVDGRRFLVSPRGTTEWVRNLRAAGGGELRIGRRSEAFRAAELADGDKAPVLRAYLDRWGFEVGRFFEGVGKNPTAEELSTVACSFPVFVLQQAA